MLLFRPSKIEFSVEYSPRLMTDFYPVKVYLCNSSGFILSLMSTVSVLSRKFSEEGLMEGGMSFLMGIETNCFASSFSVLALQGVFPVSIS